MNQDLVSRQRFVAISEYFKQNKDEYSVKGARQKFSKLGFSAKAVQEVDIVMYWFKKICEDADFFSYTEVRRYLAFCIFMEQFDFVETYYSKFLISPLQYDAVEPRELKFCYRLLEEMGAQRITNKEHAIYLTKHKFNSHKSDSIHWKMCVENVSRLYCISGSKILIFHTNGQFAKKTLFEFC